MSNVDWNERFIDLADYIGNWSKDRSTGVGAVIADKEHRIISIGYNGFPTGIDDDIDSRHERPVKYTYTEHAERNAIYNAARIGVSTKGCTIYLKWFPCSRCARAIIQSGIDTLVCYKPDFTIPVWGEDFKFALEMLEEAPNLEIIYMD